MDYSRINLSNQAMVMEQRGWGLVFIMGAGNNGEQG